MLLLQTYDTDEVDEMPNSVEPHQTTSFNNIPSRGEA